MFDRLQAPPAARPMRPRIEVSRREFLISTALVGSTLLVGCSSAPPIAAPAKVSAAAGPSPFDAYLAIARDGSVTVYSSQFDMGQLVYHGLATLVAEELEVPLAGIRVEGRAGNPKLYGNPMMGGALQLTGGSTSMPGSWLRYRQAGATARLLLLQAAADQWQLPVTALRAENGMVIDPSSARRLGYGELIEAAAKLPIPAEVALKSAKDFRLIGRDEKFHLGSNAKSNGSQKFTIDLKLPGMKVATILRSPRFGGSVKSFDATAAKAIAGVTDVVQISTGVAVVADSTWAAIKGREALKVDWDFAAAETRSSQQILDEFEQLSLTTGKPATTRGDAKAAIGRATRSIEAVYRFPYLAHAALEPLNALAHKDGDTLHLYGGLQMPDVVQNTCAAIAGIPASSVALHVQVTGGGFGRRAVADCDVFVEATEIAKALAFQYPIQLQWTREADMGGGRYRPAHVHRIKVGLDAAGNISGWQHHIVGQSIMAGTAFEAFMKDGIDSSSTEGVTTTPYLFADFDVQVTHPKSPVTVLWWRSVGHTHTAYAMESMIDEIASATGQDPVALRLKLLKPDARERAVLALAAEKAGWSQPLAAGRFRGIAVHSSFGSFVATVAEVSKDASGKIKVERCVVASDCGVVVNPDIVRAQLEGGSGFALSAFLDEAVTLERGAPVNLNYDGYRPLRIEAMPQIECHLLASSIDPTGIGECAVPPLGPAVANAIFQATGKRVRQLPYLNA